MTPSAPFVRYLLTTSACGVILGATHGTAVGLHEYVSDIRGRQLNLSEAVYWFGPRMAKDGLAGGLLGPWAPVAVPYWIYNKIACPAVNAWKEKCMK